MPNFQTSAKRSPSILVTDSCCNPNGQNAASFAAASERRGLLDSASMFGSQPSSTTSLMAKNYTSQTPESGDVERQLEAPCAKTMLSIVSIESALADVNKTAQSFESHEEAFSSGTAYHEPKSPKLTSRFIHSIPQRGTKHSAKLVLIPEKDLLPFSSNFDPDDDDDCGPPLPPSANPAQEDGSDTRKTNAERIPKNQRAGKFPRVTAYCVADAINLAKTANFIRMHHKALPRIYGEVLFAPYSLPLLPGGETGSRIKCSPTKTSVVEELIDHHHECCSGLKSATTEIGAEDKYQTRDEVQKDNNLDSSRSQSFPTITIRDLSGEQNSIPLSDRHSLKNSTTVTVESSLPETNSFLKTTEDNIDPAAIKSDEEQGKLDFNQTRAEIFVFSYGIIVFWNFTKIQEQDILADLTYEGQGLGPGLGQLLIRPIMCEADVEMEELHFTYSTHAIKPRIYNDMITLRSGDHMIKLAMSHAISQSTKVSRFEARMNGAMQDVRDVPRALALTGRLGLKREDVLKLSGCLYKLRVDVNLSSNVLDQPGFFWEDEPSLNPLYTAVREYLEIEQRILVLNERCMVFLDFTDIIADSVAESNMSRITWIIIFLIALSLAVSTLEIVVRFTILKEGAKRHIPPKWEG